MMRTLVSSLTYQGIPVWRHIQVLQWTSQIVSAVVVVVLVLWFFANIGRAIQVRDIPYGFDFLSRAYQTPIGQHFLPYESSDTFLYALGVAATNTLIVAIVGIILAIALGIVVGVGRLSRNWLVARIATRPTSSSFATSPCLSSSSSGSTSFWPSRRYGRATLLPGAST